MRGSAYFCGMAEVFPVLVLLGDLGAEAGPGRFGCFLESFFVLFTFWLLLVGNYTPPSLSRPTFSFSFLFFYFLFLLEAWKGQHPPNIHPFFSLSLSVISTEYSPSFTCSIMLCRSSDKYFVILRHMKSLTKRFRLTFFLSGSVFFSFIYCISYAGLDRVCD
jgi:hypothetical protein